ncbi:MAG: alpha-L-fucosidase [Kiritimatiellae bacterium]|nr:alpha-L-fucosidase [Kiritimatiellia bacterium]
MQKMLGLLAAVALLAASQPVLALSVSSGPIPPKPGPALAARIKAGDCEVYGIVHWGLNTYTDREWGYGDEDPALLNPAKFDADQIVGACKSGGLGGLIVVAKHHDGFCLWPTKTTEHNITKTPFWRGTGNGERGTGRDYVKEMERACRKAGLRFGVYVSPWDRHDPDYATPKYVEKYHSQIKELLFGDYGEIFEIWFDGANGGDGWYGGAKERRRIGVASDYYRFPEVFTFVRALQPKVCIFAGESDNSDFRWPGNEKGELDPNSSATICTVGGFADGKYGNPDYKVHINRGMRNFENTAGHPLFFRVCECDFPMRPGWFYHAKERGKTKSAAYLMQRYLNTVGNGGTMNIGIAPNKDGRLDEEDVKALKGFKELKDAFFAKPVYGSGRANVVVLWENVEHGELAPGWKLVRKAQAGTSASGEVPLASGKVIGAKRIRILPESVPVEEIKLARPTVADFAGPLPKDYFIYARHYYTDPELIHLIQSATTESGETDTAKWMTAGKQGDATIH